MDDSLLDEALADFESSGAQPAGDHEAKFPAGPADARTASSSGPSAAAASTSVQDKAPAFDPLGKQQPRAKSTPPSSSSSGPAFNPLGKAKGKKPAGSKSSATTAQPSQSQSSSTDDRGQQAAETSSRGAPASLSSADGGIDTELARGVAQLMADLAKADMVTSSSGRDADKVSPHEREIASTLAALAAAVPSNRGPDAANGSRLEEQLGGGDADSSFASLADSIMQQLLSKDVLYQPMKDIGAKYPAWLAAHRDKLPKEELQRFDLQYSYIRQICALYEEDPNNFGKLFSLIQEMQACGQPPEEIVQDLAPGLAFGEDGLPQLPTSGGANNCCIS